MYLIQDSASIITAQEAGLDTRSYTVYDGVIRDKTILGDE